MSLKDYSPSDSYTYKNSPVLINLRDIRDPELLEQFEAGAVTLRAAQLLLRPIHGRFDLDHLKAIHRHLFQDVYSWAGKIRIVNISKGSTTFGFAQYIEGHLIKELGNIASENFLKDLDRSRTAQRLAYYLAEINAAHPFREGNGRAQREFIRELALVSGRNVNWTIPSREELYKASTDSMSGDLSGLINILERALIP